MINSTHSLLLIITVSLVTIATRFLPFIVFGKKVPKIITYLGNVLPFAIIGMLVVYCLKNVSFISGTYGIKEIIAILLVVVLHKWKHNTLLSILAGTLAYMLMVQFIF